MPQATQIIEQATHEQEILRGVIDRVVFHNPDNGYCVLKVTPEGDSLADEITAVGYLPSIREGDEYTFIGFWKNHLKFGRQFSFTEHELVMPTTRAGIIAYMADVAHGIGRVKAGRIVDALGEDCLEKIQADPRALAGVPGITMEQAEEIHQALVSNRVLADLSALICRQGVTPRLAARIYAKYGAESLAVVKENPYLLADEMWGVGFVTADRVAQAVGIAPDSPYRIQAAVLYILREAENDGHCYLRPRDIMARLPEALGRGHGLSAEQVGAAVKDLTETGRLVREGDFIYQTDLYLAEKALAGMIRALLNGEPPEICGVPDLIEDMQAGFGILYNDRQAEAIETALTSPISVITGGPGTGKTTVTRALVEAYLKTFPDHYLYLASPTGRAARRLSEAAGWEAKTIHRLLRYSPTYGVFEYDAANPLPGPGLIIVDEFSMCDVRLAYHLFAALPQNMRVVLVGDVDQLPSVGPGNVLRDLILSRQVPMVRLEFVYRQEEGSKIAYLADLVRRGVTPDLPALAGGEVKVIFVEDQEAAAGYVVDEAARLAGKYGNMGFAVLAPMKRGPAGVMALNTAVGARINPPGAGSEVFLGGVSYRPGDKVMVVKNDYAKGVFNGDVGLVLEVKTGEELEVIVDFGYDEPVSFGPDDAGLITPAWASTVHKAQGSEFSSVVVVLTRGHYVMLQRNLFYTAVTRAKKELILVVQPEAVDIAIANDKIRERYSRLRNLLAL